MVQMVGKGNGQQVSYNHEALYVSSIMGTPTVPLPVALVRLTRPLEFTPTQGKANGQSVLHGFLFLPTAAYMGLSVGSDGLASVYVGMCEREGGDVPGAMLLAREMARAWGLEHRLQGDLLIDRFKSKVRDETMIYERSKCLLRHFGVSDLPQAYGITRYMLCQNIVDHQREMPRICRKFGESTGDETRRRQSGVQTIPIGIQIVGTVPKELLDALGIPHDESGE